jgi:rubrerythrin
MSMREIINSLLYRNYFATCRFCGYSGSDWKDSGNCPSCGENN